MNAEMSDELYLRFRELLLERSGLYYPERKRADLAHGLGLVLAATAHPSLEALYADAVAGGPGWEAIVAQLTIGETYFFRHSAQFEALREQILPDLLERRAALRTLRLWSAGCATGEEPYSLAILLHELLPDDSFWSVSILATDINPVFLGRAREALYGAWSFRETPAELRERYWAEEGGRWRLRPDIRRMVSFTRLNLAEPSFPTIANGTCALDIIVCRNVTIYFDEATTRKVAERFYSALTPGGWLIVGHAEPQASIYHQFEVHNFPNTVVYRKPLDAPLFAFDPQSGVFNRGVRPILSHRSISDVVPSKQARRHEAGERGQGRGDRAEGTGETILGIDTPISRASNHPTFVAPSPPAALDLWPAITLRLARGDKAGAELLLNDLLRADPAHVPALVALGRLHADRAEWPSAQRQCQLALDYDPLCVPAHYLMAQICEHQGQLDAALAAYRRSLYLDRGFVLGMLGMANVWRRMGRPADAQRYYRNALQHLGALSPTAAIPHADGATAAELITLITQQLRAIASV